MDRLWRSNFSAGSRTGCPLGMINDEDHKDESCGATVSMCLHSTKSKIFKYDALSMANTSLNDHVCSNASCLYNNRNDNFNYVNQLRVLTISNENFEVDLIPLYDEFMLSKNQIKRKYFQNNFAQSDKNHVKSKWLEKMKQLKKHILFFDFLENYYVPNNEVSKQHLSMIRKSNLVKTSSFKVSDDRTPTTSLIEQTNSTNESLHVIGQQPDHSENTAFTKNSEKSVLIEKSNMLEVVDKMLSDLKIKIESTSGSTPCTISKNEKEIISDEHTDSDTISSIPVKEILNDELPRLVENPKPMSFTQNWYSESIPPDIQFQKRIFQPQFSVPIDKPHKWNTAGLSEQKISHMSEFGIAHQNNYENQPGIVDLLVNDSSTTLYKWWDLYPTRLLIFAKHIDTFDCGTLDGLNTPIYTIPKYFTGIPSNISTRVSGLMNTFTMINYKWYQDVFVSRNMLQQDCHL